MSFQQDKKFFATLAGLLFIGAMFVMPVRVSADTIIFTDSCNAGGPFNLDVSPTVTVGTAWSARQTLAGTPATTIQTAIAQCTPSADALNIGMGYTMSPAPTTMQYYVDYLWVDGGTVSTDNGWNVLVNYINTSNYYYCALKDDATPDAYIYKVTGGVGSTLATNADRTVASGAKVECRIDYSGTNPVITMTNITTGTQLITATDSSSPLTRTGGAGIACGATPADTGDDCESQLDAQTIRLSTVPDPPSVTTSFASNVGVTTARLNAVITSIGGDSVTQHGFATSTVETLATNVATTSLGNGAAGEFGGGVINLSADTTYYYRAYATNSSGTSYGSVMSFSTGNTTVKRTMRLFEGYKLKLASGRLVLYQKNESAINLSFVTSDTSTTATIAVPGTAQAGDLAIVFDYATGGVPVTNVVPTDFTQLDTVAFTGVVFNRATISAKILVGGETTLTGMDGASADKKIIAIFRPTGTLSSFTVASQSREGILTDPTLQTITAATAPSKPVLLYGFMGSSGVIDPRSTSPAMNEITGTATNNYAHYYIYNPADTPADHTYDMTDEGEQVLLSGYLTFD